MAQLLLPTNASAAEDCNLGGKAGNGQIDLYGHCVGEYGNLGGAAPQTRVVACGGVGGPCAGPGDLRECEFTGVDGSMQFSAPFYTETLINGRWMAGALWCPGNAVPAPAAAAIREQAIRLLPKVTAGHAFSDAAIVRAEEIFWANTPTVRALPDVTVVGQTVQLQIDLQQVRWDFGDGATDTSDEPGRAYDPDDPCTTKQCPGYYGHTYTTSGTMTVTTTITWTARYRLAGGAWTDIAQPITGPATTQQLRVVEGRGVLVPNSR